MPSLPSTSLLNVEVIMSGTAAATGATAKKIDNVYHFKRTTNVNALNKANIEAAFQTAIGSVVIAALNVGYTQTTTSIRFIDDALDSPQSFVEASTGAISGDPMPDLAAAVLQLKTSLRGKSYRGSKHFAPLSESDSIGNTINSGCQTRLNAIGTAITTGFTDSDGNIWLSTIYSRFLSIPTPNPTTIIANQIISSLLNLTLGTMKRRKPRTVN